MCRVCEMARWPKWRTYQYVRHFGHLSVWLLSTADAAKTIVHAFTAFRLDYCNSLLHGITDSLFRRLQSVVQNAAACRITGTRRRDHSTSVLWDVLRWLPVRRRVDYKLALLYFISRCTAWRRLTLVTYCTWYPYTVHDIDVQRRFTKRLSGFIAICPIKNVYNQLTYNP